MEYKVKDRLNNQIIIKESKINIFLYTTKLGRILLKIIVLPFISKIVGNLHFCRLLNKTL